MKLHTAKRLLIAVALVAALFAQWGSARASRPSPDSSGTGRICVKTQQYPFIYRCYWR